MTIDGIEFRIRTLTAREKAQMSSVGLRGKTKVDDINGQMMFSAAMVAFACVDNDGKRIYGPADVSDVKDWEAFRDDFSEWSSNVTDELVDEIARFTRLNRSVADAAKNSEQTPTSDSP